MADMKRLTKATGDYLRGFVSENGNYYRTERQNLDGAIKHVQSIRDKHAYATKSSNPNEWRHVGSVPIVVISDWCRRNGYTFDQFARKEGNIREEFKRYFFSREFSKLHNEHVTTKRESSQIVVPNYIGRKDGSRDVQRPKEHDSEMG